MNELRLLGSLQNSAAPQTVAGIAVVSSLHLIELSRRTALVPCSPCLS